jgi:hypothetical protein
MKDSAVTDHESRELWANGAALVAAAAINMKLYYTDDAELCLVVALINGLWCIVPLELWIE